MWLDNASEIDMLAYDPYAQLIDDITSNNHMNPLTIGLLGNWGSGKSTLLHLIEKKLNENKEHRKTITINVNAWMFEGYDDAKAALMEVIISTLEENQTLSKDIKEKLIKLRERVDWFRLGGMVIKKGIPIAMSASLGNPLPLIIEALRGIDLSSADSQNKIEGNFNKLKGLLKDNAEENVTKNIRMFRSEFESLLNDSDIDNLVIIVDDLDRCNPERIMETLEAIKLFLSVKKTTFIISMDEDVINYAIKRKYPLIDEINSLDISKDYIEKIIQIPIRIPQLSDVEVKNYLLLLICEMYLQREWLHKLLDHLREDGLMIKGEIISQSELVEFLTVQESLEGNNKVYITTEGKENLEKQLDIFSKISDVTASVLKGNPRQTKRFLNTFFLRMRLSEIQKLHLDMAVLAKLMVLEYKKIDLFRQLNSWQLESEGYALKLSEIEEATFSEGSEFQSIKDEHNAWFMEDIQEWVKTEPTEFSKIDLRQYFYLAKESIIERQSSSLNLTSKEREWVNVLSNIELKGPLWKQKFKKFIEDQNIEQNKIIKGLITRFHLKRKSLLFVILSLYENFEKQRPTLIEEIKKMSKEEVDFTSIKEFNKIKKLDESAYKSLKEYLTKQKNVDVKLWEKIEDGNRKKR